MLPVMKTEGVLQMFLKFKYVKVISVILACVLLCGAFVGCNGNDEVITTEPAASDTESDTVSSDGEKVVLASNGKTDFFIWVASEIYANYPDVIKQLNDVVTLIKNKTDAYVKISSDVSYSVTASKKPAILIGDTRFAESKQVSGEMKTKDYYVGLIKDKIVINGGDVDGVSKAIRYFYITVLSSQKVVDKTMYFDSAVHTLHQTEKYDINSIKFGDVELGKLNIVLPKNANVNERDFAYSLRCWLYKRYGYRMEIVDDSTAKGEHEVLVGNTNRHSAMSLEENEYSISVSGEALCFAAGGMLSYNEMYSYVTGTLFKPTGLADYSLPSSYSYKTAATGKVDDGSWLLSEKTGQVRMMSYNVFGNIVNYDDGTSTGPIEYRQQLQLEMISAYAPDVVGLQEFSQKNYKNVTAKMNGLGYTLVPNNSSTWNNNPLFYNKKTLELVNSGYHVYTGIEEQKAAAWAVFTVKETGKKFVAISTHFMWNSTKLTTEEAAEARKLNAKELLKLVSEIRALGYGELPVIMGGDYNCKLETEPLQAIKQAGFSCAREVAARKNDTNGHHTYSRYDNEFEAYSIVYTPNKKHSSAIDHMFVSSGITVNSFAAITLPYALYASDHCPTVTDFIVN